MAVNYSHPYFPRDLYLPDFILGVISQFTILGVYGTVSFFSFILGLFQATSLKYQRLIDV